MARVTKQMVVNKVSVVLETMPRGNPPYTGPWTYDSTRILNGRGDGTSHTVTRDELRLTPRGAPYKPLEYFANGQSAASIFINAVCRSPGGTRAWRRQTVVGSWGALVPAIPKPLPFSEGLIAERKIRMLKAIGDQKWSVGESLAEAKEGVNMIAKSAKTLQSALMAAARKDWRRVASILGVRPKKLGKAADNVADGWLAYSFGWTPIVGDMCNAMVYLSGIDKSDKLTLSASSRVEERTFASYDSGEYDVASYDALPFNLRVKGRHELELHWKARVTYKVRISSLRELQRYGLIGLSTPWARMPGSFILDWIIPIGDYLAAVDATAGLSFDSGFETRFARARLLDLEGSFRLSDLLADMDQFSAEAVGVGTNFSMSRTKWGGLAPPFYVKDPLDLWKAVTSLALFKRDAYGVRSAMARK